MPQLGLGCPPNFSMVNPPPVMVAILRGEFDFRGVGPGFRYAQAPVTGKEQYAYYVFDVWNALPVITMSSGDGALFRQALHDSTLPDKPEVRLPAACAPQNLGFPRSEMPQPPTAQPGATRPPTQPPMPPPVATFGPVALTPAAKP